MDTFLCDMYATIGPLKKDNYILTSVDLVGDDWLVFGFDNSQVFVNQDRPDIHWSTIKIHSDKRIDFFCKIGNHELRSQKRPTDFESWKSWMFYCLHTLMEAKLYLVDATLASRYNLTVTLTFSRQAKSAQN